jgi:hypothetical protein
MKLFTFVYSKILEDIKSDENEAGKLQIFSFLRKINNILLFTIPEYYNIQ